MTVILTEDHDTLGMKGDVVDVKPGFGQNYLIPNQLAVVATKSTRKRYEEERRQAAHKIEAARGNAEKLAEKLNGTEIVIPVKTGDDDERLFGTVTTAQVVDELKTMGFELDRRKVSMEDVKTTGVYTATVRLHPEITAEVKVKVVPEEASL